jgi:hypothetical protein
MGTEEIYQYLQQPLQPDAPDGPWEYDYERLSPTCTRLITWDYREALRPWFDTLEPQPMSVDALAQAWHQEWKRKYGNYPPESPNYKDPTLTPDPTPPSSPPTAPPPSPPVKGPFSDYSEPKPLFFPVRSGYRHIPGTPSKSTPHLDEFGNPRYRPDSATAQPLQSPAQPKTYRDHYTQTKRPRLSEKGTSPSSPSSRRHSSPRYSNRYSPLADDDADDEDSTGSAPPRAFRPIATGPPHHSHDPTHCRCSSATEECVSRQHSS